MKPNEFDNFSLSRYRKCPEYFRRRIDQSLVKPSHVKVAAEFGTAIHMALECWYKGGMTDQAIDEALAKFMIHFSQFESPADDKRTIARGLFILAEYFKKYRHEPFEVIATEIGGAFQLTPKYTYQLRLDLVVRWFSPEGVYGYDHKTTSSLDSLVTKPNNQFSGYFYYLNEFYENVLGFMCNLIGVYKTTTQKDKRTGKMVDREIFQRVPTTRNPRDLQIWKEGVLHTIHQIEESRQLNKWPRYDSCKMYWTDCPYLDLCNASSMGVEEKMIEGGFYEVEEWNAFKADDETLTD